MDRDHLHSKMNICTRFEELMSIICLVIICRRFSLYFIKLMATVTLAYDKLISKPIETIYTPNVCAKFEKPMSILSSYHPDNVWSIYQHLDVTKTLTFDPLISKSIGIIFTAKFDEPWVILCLVIIWTRFGLYISMLMVTMTLIKINRDHLDSEMYVSNLKNLSQFCV